MNLKRCSTKTDAASLPPLAAGESPGHGWASSRVSAGLVRASGCCIVPRAAPMTAVLEAVAALSGQPLLWREPRLVDDLTPADVFAADVPRVFLRRRAEDGLRGRSVQALYDLLLLHRARDRLVQLRHHG